MIKHEIKLNKKTIQEFEKCLTEIAGRFYYEETYKLNDNKTLKIVFSDVNDGIIKFIKIGLSITSKSSKTTACDITIKSKTELFTVHRRAFKSKDFKEVLLLKISAFDEKSEGCLLKYCFQNNDLNNMVNVVEFNSFHKQKELVEALAVIVHLYPQFNKFPEGLIKNKKEFIINKLEYFGYDNEYLTNFKITAGMSDFERLISWALDTVYNNRTKQVVNDMELIDTYNNILF